MIERQNIFPQDMPKRIVNGHLLYTPVVTVVPGKLVFLSGILSRNSQGQIVGKGDMAAQIRQVFENIEARIEHGGDNLSTSTTVEVRRLSHPDFLIEVEVMAVIPQS